MRLTQRMIGNALLLFIAGCAFLLYLPLRSLANPALNYAGHYDEMGVFHPLQLTNLNNLIWYVTGGPFQSLIGSYTRPELLIEMWETLVRLNAAFLGIGLPLGLVGIGVLWRRNRPIILAVLLTLIPHAKYVDLKDAHHMVAGDKNDAFTGSVLRFLRELPG